MRKCILVLVISVCILIAGSSEMNNGLSLNKINSVEMPSLGGKQYLPDSEASLSLKLELKKELKKYNKGDFKQQALKLKSKERKPINKKFHIQTSKYLKFNLLKFKFD